MKHIGMQDNEACRLVCSERGAFCIILNPKLNGMLRVVHLYWQLMACGMCGVDTKATYVEEICFR